MSLRVFAIATMFFLFADLIWIGYLGNSLYRDGYGELLRKSGGMITPNWYSAIVVYVLCITGMMILLAPACAGGNQLLYVAYGALYGLVLYGFYNFTNHAVFANWPINLVIIDTIWGTLLCAMTNLCIFYAQKLLQ